MSSTFTINRRNVLAGALAFGAVAAVGRGVTFAQDSTPATTTLDPVTEAGWTWFNLNAASDEQFLTIPAVSDRMLREFNEYKPYGSIDQFRAEIGKYVSEEEVAAYEEYVFAPIDPTQATEATIGQLPGVSADDAAELVKGVPYADDAAFLTALGGYVSPAQLAAAPQYLASTAAATATWIVFNLNTASDEQFLTITGVGDKMLDEFNEYKPYSSIVQFREEIGKYVSEEEVAGYEDYLFVPIDPTQADEATLAQLPGVDADEAAELAKGVPYADAAALIAALGSYVSADQATAAAAFIATA